MSAQEQNLEYHMQRVAALEKLVVDQAKMIEELTEINQEYFQLWEEQKEKYAEIKKTKITKP